MKTIPTFSELFFGLFFVVFILTLMSILDDGYDMKKLDQQVKAESIQQAKAEQEERKREFNRMAFEAQRMTGFQAVMK